LLFTLGTAGLSQAQTPRSSDVPFPPVIQEPPSPLVKAP
jgi:hypothetical protein